MQGRLAQSAATSSSVELASASSAHVEMLEIYTSYACSIILHNVPEVYIGKLNVAKFYLPWASYRPTHSRL